LTIVLSDLSWPLYCLIFLDQCIVWSFLTIVLSDLSWPLYCLIFLDHCIVWPIYGYLLLLWYLQTFVSWLLHVINLSKGPSWPWSYGCWIYNYRSVQSVIITTKIVSLHPVHGEVYSIWHFVIKFVSDLWQFGGFLRVIRFPQQIKLIATL
jgi:hypothetical protein